MAIAYVNAGNAGVPSTSGGTNSITVALPASITQGNLLVLCASLSGRNFSSITQSYTQLVNETTLTSHIWVGYKFAGVSETAPVLTASGTMASGSAIIVQYSGVLSTDVTGTTTGTATTSLATATLTTTVANDLVLSFYGWGTASTAAQTYTAPSGPTSRINSSASTTSNGIVIVDEIQATASTTTARTCTANNTSNPGTSVAISFKPTLTNTGRMFLLF